MPTEFLDTTKPPCALIGIWVTVGVLIVALAFVEQRRESCRAFA
jgi:hypothetical protein